MAYYNNVNPDVLNLMPVTARHILEIGCGEGNLARAYRQRNPGCRYTGVELNAEAASKAASAADAIICGDIESPDCLSQLRQQTQAAPDVLVFGDVLEHLQHPWLLLEQLRGLMAPDGLCIACIPNVSHWSLLEQQLRGKWTYADEGLLDRTHLRFFTCDSAIDLFKTAGWHVLSVRPRILWPDKTREKIDAFRPISASLGIAADKMERDLSAFQWVLRSTINRPRELLHVYGMGLRKVAGVTEARIDHPLESLGSLPDCRAIWSSGNTLKIDEQHPGILLLHRQFADTSAFQQQIERLAQSGWIIVSEMDDDPHHWPQFVQSDFHAYRGVHAVSVSTEPLAEMIRQWNPNVMVFPNAIAQLSDINRPALDGTRRMRVFFGALNRLDDWKTIEAGVYEFARRRCEQVEFVIVHEREVFERLPDECHKSFHPTLPHAHYMNLLSSCDVALLPLNDTPFNRLKSDIKLIECAAAGVAPICSPVVYADRPEHSVFACFADEPGQWLGHLCRLSEHPEEIEQRAQQANLYVKQQRMHAYQTEARRQWFARLLAAQPDFEQDRRQRLEQWRQKKEAV